MKSNSKGFTIKYIDFPVNACIIGLFMVEQLLEKL